MLSNPGSAKTSPPERKRLERYAVTSHQGHLTFDGSCGAQSVKSLTFRESGIFATPQPLRGQRRVARASSLSRSTGARDNSVLPHLQPQYWERVLQDDMSTQASPLPTKFPLWPYLPEGSDLGLRRCTVSARPCWWRASRPRHLPC